MSSQDSPSPAPESSPNYVEIGTDGQDAQGFLDKHFKLILILALALLLGLFGWIIWQWTQERAQNAAANALSKASDREELQAVAKDHAGTAAGGTALLKLAAQFHGEGEVAQAKETWQQFLDAYAEHPLRSQAVLALAAAQRSEGDIEAARQTLQTLPTEDATGLQVIAGIVQGDYQLQQGDADTAVGIWSEATKENLGEAAYLKSIVNDRVQVSRAGEPEVVAELPARSEGEVMQEKLIQERELLQQQFREMQSGGDAEGEVGTASLDLDALGLGDEALEAPAPPSSGEVERILPPELEVPETNLELDAPETNLDSELTPELGTELQVP